jgi:multicomponent Na+:H+ antiporter subunit C
MTLLESLAVAVLFGSGAFMLLKRDLVRNVAGMVLVGNSVTLFLVAAGLTRGQAPIRPLGATVSDPLVQAMALTAIVINFGITALLLSLVYGVYATHGTLDHDDLLAAEIREHDALDADGGEP